MNRKYKILLITLFVIISGLIPYFANLYFLQQYDQPKIRGNHVGLSALSWVVFWVIVLVVRKRIKSN